MNYRVLAVTADSLDALALKSVLEQDDRVSFCHLSDTRELWESVASDSPDLVLLDMDALGEKAQGILRELLNKHPDCLVCVATSYASLAGAVDAYRAGAADYLVKPLSPEAMADRFETAMVRVEERRVRNEKEKRNLVRQLAASINHEINNPLTTILGIAELILDDADNLDDKTCLDLETIIEQSLRIRAVTARLRDLPEIRLTKYGSWETMIDLGIAEPSAPAPSPEGAHARRPQVFLIDDNNLMIAMLQRTFQLDIEILGFSSGAKALEKLGIAGAPPEAICVDMALPDMDGIGIIERIHGLCPAVPIFLLASYHDERLITQAMQQGASRILYKPLHLMEFKETILKNLPRITGSQSKSPSARSPRLAGAGS